MRIVYGNKNIPGFKDTTGIRFKEFFGIDMDEELYNKVTFEMEKYGLIQIRDDFMSTTPRLWEYVDNSVVLY
jgi:hypothetical protein